MDKQNGIPSVFNTGWGWEDQGWADQFLESSFYNKIIFSNNHDMKLIK